MSEPNNARTLEDQVAEGKSLEAALQKAFRDVILGHARAGHAVPVSRDGKVVWLQPDQIIAELGATPLAKPDDKAGAA
jgi:hypothetical protein